MKKPLLLIVVLAVIAVGAYFLLAGRNKPAAEEARQQPIAITSKSDAFDESFTQMLNAYFQVTNALVAGDTAAATEAATGLMSAADALKVDEIRGDSTGTIRSLVNDLSATVTGSCKALQGESGIDAKRREYQMISTAMWDLIRTSRYAGGKVYKLICSRAFDNTGAEWLSTSREARNPYMGAQTTDCGTLEDSVDYSNQ